MPFVPLPCPVRSASFSITDKSASFQTRSWLTIQNIGDNLTISHVFCDPAARTVQHATSIICTISTQSIDFTGQAIVQVSAYWPTTYSTTYNTFSLVQSDRKLMTDCSFMMAVILINEVTGLPEGYWFNFRVCSLLPVTVTENTNNNNDTFYNRSSDTDPYAQAIRSLSALHGNAVSASSSFLVFLLRAPVLALHNLILMRPPAFWFKST